MNIYNLVLNSEANTTILAQSLAEQCEAGVVFLEGDLGAGKTTLTRYWLQALGVTGAIKSPTYTLVEPYQVKARQIYHFDLYRLQDPDELDMLGFPDYMADDTALIIMEWPSKAGYLQPEPQVAIRITTDGETRQVHIESQMTLDLPASLLS